MCPVLFKIGGFEVRSFGLLLLIGFLVGMWLAEKRAQRHGVEPGRILNLGIAMILFGVLGSRLAFIIQEWDFFAKDPSKLLSWRFEGLTSFGGVIAGLLTMAIWCMRSKISFLTVGDIFGVPFLVAHAIGRVGCLMNGCCYGATTALPWGVHFQDLDGVHHPAQAYDSLMTLAGVGLLVLFERRKHPAGQSLALTMVFYGISRFIYEFWRAGASSTYWGSLPITQAQAMAAILAIGGILLFILVGRRPSPKLEATPG